MSWIGGSFTIKNKDKKEISKAVQRISEIVRHNADLEEFPNMGMNIMPIKDISRGDIFESFKDAESYMNEASNWRRNYNVMVPYKSNENVKKTKKMKDLLRRIDETDQRMNKYIKDHDVSKQKAKLLSCPKCESKINKDYISFNCCPVCKTDLRSKTTKDTIRRYANKIDTLKKSYHEEEQKQMKKAPVLWLVSFEEYIG